jgi:hypothetical protein
MAYKNSFYNQEYLYNPDLLAIDTPPPPHAQGAGEVIETSRSGKDFAKSIIRNKVTYTTFNFYAETYR